MKITKIDIYLLNAGNALRRVPVVCRIHTDAGIYGDGEAGVAYGCGSTAAFGMIEDLGPLLIGQDPLQVDPLWTDMYKKSFWGLGGGAIFYSGMSALNIALMDIAGKAFNVPCYQLLGGKYRSKLRTYASQLQFGWDERQGPFGKTKDYVDITQYALSQGYDAVKIDFTYYDKDANMFEKSDFEGILPATTLALIDERLGAIRKELGYNFDIIVENHCRTTASSAIQIGELCDIYKAFAYEEPVSPMYPQMQAEVRAKVKTPLASGERIYTRWQYIKFFEQGSIQLIQPDVCNCGGLTETKKISDLADIFDVSVQAHVAGGPISTAAAIQLEAAIPNFSIHEHHNTSTVAGVRALGKYDYQPVKGQFIVPELPGIAQEISDFAIDTALRHTTVDTPK